jgi:hypothetical protein
MREDYIRGAKCAGTVAGAGLRCETGAMRPGLYGINQQLVQRDQRKDQAGDGSAIDSNGWQACKMDTR